MAKNGDFALLNDTFLVVDECFTSLFAPGRVPWLYERLICLLVSADPDVTKNGVQVGLLDFS